MKQLTSSSDFKSYVCGISKVAEYETPEVNGIVLQSHGDVYLSLVCVFENLVM